MLVHLRDQVLIPLQIVIATNGKLSMPQKRCFKHQIIIRVSTKLQVTNGRNLNGILCNQPQELSDVASPQAILVAYSWAR